MIRLLPAVCLLLLASGFAVARDQGQWKYAEPDVAEWYRTLMMPDIGTPVSCCGEGDAYYADKQDVDPATGGIIAIITDERPDEPRARMHVPVGTRIPVPASKIRKHPIPNPTEHTVVFLSIYQNVMCYEPVSLW